jgi:BirA family biotin operon repressor/biotin-[acetyl-CoA-carboxylase] ligase
MEFEAVPGAGLWHARMLRLEQVPSTNQWALDHLPTLQNGDVVWALHQTAGRGRLGRSWHDVPGKNLLVSVVLTDPTCLGLTPNIGQVAALGVRDTLRHYGIPGTVKWPNDVMVGERKIAGMLVEAAPGKAGCVMGIGLNVDMSADELAAAPLDPPPTSMAAELGRRVDLRPVLTVLLRALATWFAAVRSRGLGPLLEAWAESDWLAGHWVEVQTERGAVQGRYAGLDEAGRLCLGDAAGNVQAFWTGDAHRLRRS